MLYLGIRCWKFASLFLSLNSNTELGADAEKSPLGKREQGKELLRLLVWVAVCLGVPLLVLSGKPKPVPDLRAEDAPDVAGMIRELRAAQPDSIGIGNSMMFTRLGRKPEAMSDLTGRRFHFLYKGGADATVWFLMLKNIVQASGVRPKAVLLFVRDNELTAPYFGKDDAASTYRDGLRGSTEPELDRFIQAARKGPEVTQKMDRWLVTAFSFPEWQEIMSRRMMDVAMDLGGLGAPKKAQRFALSARFGLEHLRGDLAADLPVVDELSLMTGSYEQVADASLLPEMLKVAQSCGARLIVFRVKRRPDALTHLPEEPDAMRGYAQFLGDWLKERGGAFFDETYDTSIRLADYLDGDHIRPERQEWYRDYFWQRMNGLFP